ncbi:MULTISPECIES: hypothetical protein [Bacteria]|uniref:hypothetical protein n=1 Tax=Bacteria TaxID=2 RepID=UPI003C7CDCB8
MTTENTASENTPDGVAPENAPSHGAERPFGFWITAVDRLLRAEFATAFEREGITRRDWRLLNLVDGTVPAGRPLRAEKLRRLVELGWVSPDDHGWTPTDEGRAAKDRLGSIVDDIRARVAAAVEPEEFAVMTSSLEKVARELGWHEGMRLPRTGRDRRDFGGFARHEHHHGGHRLGADSTRQHGHAHDHGDARHTGSGERCGHRAHHGRHGMPGHGLGPHDGRARHLHIHLHD